jgi:hypothetical protein
MSHTIRTLRARIALWLLPAGYYIRQQQPVDTYVEYDWP